MHVGIRADEGANTWAIENRTTQIRHLVRMLSILSAAHLSKLTNSQQKLSTMHGSRPSYLI